MERHARIYIAGHRGMVGSAILRRLRAEGFDQLLTRRHAELDLTDQAAVHRFFQNHPIDHVVLAAARVGGIQANNNYPAEFIYQNLMIEANVIHAAYRAGVRRLLFLGSSCIYPKHAAQPLMEEDLLGGWLEPTNEPYAVAKIAGIKLCESYNRQYGTDYRSLMPTNLYGPGDNYDLETSHVLPAMIRKFHLAKLAQASEWEAITADEARHGTIPDEIRASLRGLDHPASGVHPGVILWGSGRPYREFLHVDDLADACLFFMQLSAGTLAGVLKAERLAAAGRVAGEDTAHNLRPETCLINVGTGRDLTIRELAETVAAVVGYSGEISWDAGKPDGTPRKQLDTSRLTQLGWTPRIELREGIRRTYRTYLEV
ncbi:MAG: GDP-L-fucose synthase [Desulfobacterales bacterium]|nr:GDP-L-fucose synthase [Desulfobacterales bacterium]